MGLNWSEIPADLQDFIRAQLVYFVATAPADGRVNLSPKGLDTLRILDSRTVAYLDLTGSGNETAAHVTENGRMTMLFCAFTGDAMTLRLYGKAEVLRPGHPDWERMLAIFPTLPGTRQIFRLIIDRVATSCGWSIPTITGMTERRALIGWAEENGPDGLERYRLEHNVVSIDGLSTGYLPDDFGDDEPGSAAAPATAVDRAGTPPPPARAAPVLAADAADSALVHLEYADGEVMRFAPLPDRTLLESAEAAGHILASNCRAGTCRTCQVRDAEGRDVLLCVTPATAPFVAALPYRRTDLIQPSTRRAKITGLEKVSASVWALRYRLQFPLAFLPGQYVEVSLPGIDGPRRFSMATAPGDGEHMLLIRNLPGSATATYFTTRAKIGDMFSLRGPFGVFYPRAGGGPKIFVAGGTGLAPILSMLRASPPDVSPMLLIVGASTPADACELEAISAQAARLPLRVMLCSSRDLTPDWACEDGSDWQRVAGNPLRGVELGLAQFGPLASETEAYLCGPPAMVEAVRTRLLAHGLDPACIFNEEFLHSHGVQAAE